MKILKLSQSIIVTRCVDSIVGFEEETIYEPIFINSDHIESFHFAGSTYLNMTSGEKIRVSETAEEIIRLLNHEGYEQLI